MNYIVYFAPVVPPVSTIKPEEGDYYPFLLNLNSASSCTTGSHHSSGTDSFIIIVIENCVIISVEVMSLHW
jgi:hypothetical protein